MLVVGILDEVIIFSGISRLTSTTGHTNAPAAIKASLDCTSIDAHSRGSSGGRKLLLVHIPVDVIASSQLDLVIASGNHPQQSTFSTESRTAGMHCLQFADPERKAQY
jgi:hypothetical protein